MDIQELYTLIGNFCFPIAACVFLAYENRSARNDNKTSMANIMEVLERNTLAITRLVDKLEK